MQNKIKDVRKAFRPKWEIDVTTIRVTRNLLDQKKQLKESKAE